MLLNFAPAILSKRLAELNVSSKLYGLFFALPFIFPIVSAVIVVKIMDRIDSQLLLWIGKLLMGFAFILIGPSSYWGFQENIWIMLAGISLLGFAASFSIIPLMPIIMTEIKDKFKKNTSNYIDTASSLYNSSFGIGSIIGPMLGANLNSYYGFRVCADILGHFAITLFFILLVAGNFWKVFNYLKEKKQTIKNYDFTFGRVSNESSMDDALEIRETSF
jgi:MFS family permease